MACGWRHCWLICGCFFFSSRRRHTRSLCDWSSDVCSYDLALPERLDRVAGPHAHDLAHGERPAAPERREIGRASCRERVEISVGGGSLKKKEKSRRLGHHAKKYRECAKWRHGERCSTQVPT